MTWRIVNVPNCKTGRVKVTPVEGGGFYVTDQHGNGVTDMSGLTPQGVAADIETLLNKFLEIGFEQGRAHVRNALGL